MKKIKAFKRRSSVYLSSPTLFHNGMTHFSVKAYGAFVSITPFFCVFWPLTVSDQHEIQCTISNVSLTLQSTFRTSPCWIKPYKTDLNAATTKSEGLWNCNGHVKTPYREASNERRHWWFARVVFNQHYSVCTPFMHYGWDTSWTTSSPFVLSDAPVTS